MTASEGQYIVDAIHLVVFMPILQDALNANQQVFLLAKC